jgi:diacylglycerol kinase
MKEFIHRHHVSFEHAFDGLRWAIRSQPNFRIHFSLALIAIIAGIWFRISRTEMLVIIFTILLGLTGEMINTAIESMTDLITKEWRQEAKIAKDVGAGMMLLTAAGAVVIAGIIFLPHIAALF